MTLDALWPVERGAGDADRAYECVGVHAGHADGVGAGVAAISELHGAVDAPTADDAIGVDAGTTAVH